MDMFMDKLAQKLNAQEIIRANTAAEFEELDKLKSRVAEYNECLDRLQRLLQENAAGLKGAVEANTAQIQNLVGESLEKIRGIQSEGGLEDKFAAVDENVHKECVKVYRNVQAVVVEEGGKQAEILAAFSAKLDAVKGKMGLLLGISIIAVLSSLAALAFQIVGQININLF